jgi:hypothetical protein
LQHIDYWSNIQGVPGINGSILGGHNDGCSEQNSACVHVYMCPVPRSFRGRDISLNSYKFVGNKEILRTISNIGIYR